jgi:hypothetical protein
MFAVGDIVKMYVMAEEKTYYGVITGRHGRYYYGINWLDEQNPPFYAFNKMVHAYTLKKVS